VLAISATVSPALTVTVAASAAVVVTANKAKAAADDKTRFLIFIVCMHSPIIGCSV